GFQAICRKEAQKAQEIRRPHIHCAFCASSRQIVCSPCMKITDVRATLLTGPCTNDPFVREARKLRSAAFIEVLTDVGKIGIGETYAGYFCPEVVPSIVEFFKSILIGQTVDDIPELWRRMYHCGNFWCRAGLGVSVLNGLEAALWDLKGKLLD